MTNPVQLNDKEQRDAVESGKLAACTVCGVMTWVEDLKPSGLCECGSRPYIEGGPLPDVQFATREEIKANNTPAGTLQKPVSAHSRATDATETGNTASRSHHTIPGALADLRTTLGLTQEALARVLGCHVNTIYKLASGRSTTLRKKTRDALVQVAVEGKRKDLAEFFLSGSEGN